MLSLIFSTKLLQLVREWEEQHEGIRAAVEAVGVEGAHRLKILLRDGRYRVEGGAFVWISHSEGSTQY